MRTWWEQLSQREQRLLSVGALLLLLIVAYLFLYQPLTQYTDKTRTQAQQQQALLQWMQQAEQALNTLQTQSSQIKTITDATLLTTLSTLLATPPLNTSESTLAQTDNQQARIQFKQVPFDNLIQFLTLSWRQYRITTVSLETTPLNTPGLVQATIVLKIHKS